MRVGWHALLRPYVWCEQSKGKEGWKTCQDRCEGQKSTMSHSALDRTLCRRNAPETPGMSSLFTSAAEKVFYEGMVGSEGKISNNGTYPGSGLQWIWKRREGEDWARHGWAARGIPLHPICLSRRSRAPVEAPHTPFVQIDPSSSSSSPLSLTFQNLSLQFHRASANRMRGQKSEMKSHRHNSHSTGDPISRTENST